MTLQTTETQASDPAPTTIGKLTGFKFDLGHQETERIVDEMEQICKTVRNSAGEAWMLASSAQSMLCTDLGYEDAGELEVRIAAEPYPRFCTCPLNVSIHEYKTKPSHKCVFSFGQDALKAPFEEFLMALPHIETKVQVRSTPP
jgi:hypothetical protein